MIASSTTTVRARHNVWSTLYNLLGIVIGIGMIYGGIDMLRVKDESPILAIATIAMGTFIAFITIMGFTDKYTVTLNKLIKSGIMGYNEIDWKDVFEIWIHTTHFGAFVIQLHVKKLKRHVPILIPFIGNRKEVAQAIIEAATTSNPSVDIKGWEKAYGTPPFGIFVEKKSE